MGTKSAYSLIMLLVTLISTTINTAWANDISVFGQVQSYSGVPIFMIKVSVYRDMRLIGKEYTDEKGHYVVQVAPGEPITVCFDTHPTLTNAQDWHPAIVANLNAKEDITLNRFLMGTMEGVSDLATIDALNAYQFCAVLNAINPVDDYGRNAASRLANLKVPNIDLLRENQANVLDYLRYGRIPIIANRHP